MLGYGDRVEVLVLAGQEALCGIIRVLAGLLDSSDGVGQEIRERGQRAPAGFTEGSGSIAGKLGLRIGRMVVDIGYRRMSSDLWIMSFTEDMAATLAL